MDIKRTHFLLLGILFLFPIIDMSIALINFDIFINSFILGISSIFVVFGILYTSRTSEISYANLLEVSKSTQIVWALIVTICIINLAQGHGNLYRTAFTLLLISIGPILYFTLKENSHSLSTNILDMLVYGFALYSSLFLVLYFSGLYKPPFADRHFGTFPGYPNIRHVAYLLGPITLAGVFLWSGKAASTRIKFLRLTCLTALWVVLLYSGSRAAFIASIIGFCITLTFTKSYKRAVLKTLLITLSLGLFLSSQLPSEHTALGIWNMFVRSSGAEDVNALSSNRLVLWEAGFKASLERPFLGHGIGQFSDITELLGYPIVQAHNAIIEYLYALGFIGGLSLTIWVLSLWIKTIKHSRHTDTLTSTAALAGINVLMGYSLLDGVFYNYNPILITIIFFSIVLSAPNKKGHR